MSGQGKHFRKVTFGVPLLKNTKQTCFFPLFGMLLISRKGHQIIILSICLIDSGLRQSQKI
jgi:hypothetical protein